jgi:hypothetical protein
MKIVHVDKDLLEFGAGKISVSGTQNVTSVSQNTSKNSAIKVVHVDQSLLGFGATAKLSAKPALRTDPTKSTRAVKKMTRIRKKNPPRRNRTVNPYSDNVMEVRILTLFFL